MLLVLLHQGEEFVIILPAIMLGGAFFLMRWANQGDNDSDKAVADRDDAAPLEPVQTVNPIEPVEARDPGGVIAPSAGSQPSPAREPTTTREPTAATEPRERVEVDV